MFIAALLQMQITWWAGGGWGGDPYNYLNHGIYDRIDVATFKAPLMTREIIAILNKVKKQDTHCVYNMISIV